jgi:hypothetical protein
LRALPADLQQPQLHLMLRHQHHLLPFARSLQLLMLSLELLLLLLVVHHHVAAADVAPCC